MYIDGRRSGAHAEDQARSRRPLLRAGRLSRRGARARHPHGRRGQGAGGSGSAPARRRAAQARRQGVRVRARAAVRHLAADPLPPPQEAAPGGHRRLRAARPLGLLLRHPRSTGGAVLMAELTDTDIRDRVRERYAAAATAVAENTASGCCGAADAIAGCGPDIASTDKHGNEVFGVALYDAEGDAAPKAAVEASLGFGVPTAVADLHEGETVLDLGSGAGADVLISARRVGATGRAIGLDMTDEMLELARANAAG